MCRRPSRCRSGCALPGKGVLGAVLAGGASSRFGSDKALAMVGGRTLLEHAIAAVAPFVDEVVIVGRGEVPDLPRAGLGPLGGIAGALNYAEREGFASVLTVACDMYDIPEGLVASLLKHAPSYCADAPVLGHWPMQLTAGLLDRLASPPPSSRTYSGIHRRAKAGADAHAAPWAPGQARGDEGGKRPPRPLPLSVRRWGIAIGAVAIPSPSPLANINTPADLPSS